MKQKPKMKFAGAFRKASVTDFSLRLCTSAAKQ
jgi:hypothetical protein